MKVSDRVKVHLKNSDDLVAEFELSGGQVGICRPKRAKGIKSSGPRRRRGQKTMTTEEILMKVKRGWN